MDATYLKKNIMDALTEGLTSMAIKTPEDQVEFLGRYLLAYVERKQKEESDANDRASVESKYSEFKLVEDGINRVKAEESAKKTQFENKFNNFLETLVLDASTKSKTMDSVTEFIETNLDIPAAYIAVKVVIGESETLHYLSGGPSQQHVVGKKLPKVVIEEGDENPPQRQGVSFDAFKVPEVPEEEEVELEEGEERPPKVILKPTPLFIDNAMRDPRVKFLSGRPLHGAVVFIPFLYLSLDHDSGCVLGEATESPPAEEGGEPVITPAGYTLARKEIQFILAIDSVGKYRNFKPAEVARIQVIGEQMIKAFEKIENALGEAQLKYVSEDPKFKSMGEVVAAVTAKIADDEAAAIAAAAAALLPPEPVEGSDPVPAEPAVESEPVSELFKPFKDAELALSVWGPAFNATLAGGNSFTSVLLSLKNYVLPLPTIAVQLLYAISLFLGCELLHLKDICGDPSWAVIRENVFHELPAKIVAYDCTAPRFHKTIETKLACSLVALKAYAETNTLFDTSLYPANLPVFSVLVAWLQKAFAAREASLAYHEEVKKVDLEG